MYIKKPLLTTLCSLFIFFAFSCTTAPSIPDTAMEEDKFIPLDTGAFGYSFIDVPNAMPILNNLDFRGMDKNQFLPMLAKAQSAAAAFYLPYDERSFQLTAWGKFPSAGAKVALGANKGWKKYRLTKTKTTYWYSQTSRLSIVLGSKEVRISAVTGNVNKPVEPFPVHPGTPIPEGFNKFREGAVLSCWLDNPGPVINQRLERMGIPLGLPAEQIFIRVVPVTTPAESGGEQRYTLFLQIQTAGEIQARGLTTVLTFARGLFPQTANAANPNASSVLASVLFSNPPVQNGKNLNLTSAALSGKEFALLFTMFSL